MDVDAQLLLISGLPATGKTTFGDWLQAEYGFLHLDLESRDCLAVNGLPQFWPERIWNLDACGLTEFFNYLRALDKSIVMTWAFHTDLIPLFSDLVQRGCQPWWFDGDRLASREAFRRRKRVIKEGVAQPGEPNMQNYDWYVGSLLEHWKEISAIFGTHSIQTLNEDGTYLPPEDIREHIFSSH